MPRLRLAIEWLVIAFLATGVAWAAATTQSGQQLSNFLFDEELAWSEHDPDPRILIVQIDDQSLAKVGRWPWPRQVHAQLIDRLSEGGAVAVGYDVLFTEPSASTDDDALAQALSRSRRVSVPAYVEVPGQNGQPFEVRMPIAPIAHAASVIGHVNVLFDADGRVRRARMQGNRPVQMPHLMEVLARQISGLSPRLPNELVVPFNRPGAYSSISARAVLDGEVPRELLRDRIILVGATAPGLGDLLPVSGESGSIMSGVEVQANILDAILHGTWVVDGSLRMAALLAIGAVLAALILFWRMSPNQGLLVTAAMAVASLSGSAITLAIAGFWLSPVPLLAGLAVAYPLWNWRRLSALNSFVEAQTRALKSDRDATGGGTPKTKGLDAIAAAAMRLRGVIGELQDREGFLRDTIESAPDALCVVDRDGNVAMMNQLAEQIFGTGLQGMSLEALLAPLCANGIRRDDEVELSDGRTMFIKTSPFSGSPVAKGGAIVRLADVSARRIAERERDHALEFLSHDLRTPQASILTVLEGARLPDEFQSVIDRIRGYAARSLKLADDFVQLARLNHISPRSDLVDLTGVFEEAIDGLYDKAAAKGLELRLTAPEALSPICGDAALLVRAVGNLLDNAVKYGPKYSTVDCKIVLRGSLGGSADRVVCEIADQGPGIAAERIVALFERYGPNNTAAGLSAGLGLAFVKQVVDRHGGELACSSSADGTTFQLGFAIANDEIDRELLQ